MEYKKISPLGPRVGFGTFETLFDIDKYPTLEDATNANDYVILDFVIDERDLKHIECYHVRTPETKLYHRINYQHFPFGLDAMDDHFACELAATLFLK